VKHLSLTIKRLKQLRIWIRIRRHAVSESATLFGGFSGSNHLPRLELPPKSIAFGAIHRYTSHRRISHRRVSHRREPHRHASYKRISQRRAYHRRASHRIYLPKLPTPSHSGSINHDEFLTITASAYTLWDRVALMLHRFGNRYNFAANALSVPHSGAKLYRPGLRLETAWLR
jgi:hypothetical protein